MNMRSLIQPIRLLAVALAAMVLASCGGSAGSLAAVSTMQATNARFGSTTIVTVFGRSLLSGIDVAVDGPCENFTRVVGGTDDSQQFTCDVRGLGLIKFVASNTDRVTLGELSVQIPVPRVSVATSMGSFAIDLDPVKAPKTVLNFLGYVNAGFYSNVIFDTVVKDMGVITGGYTATLAAKTSTRAAIDLESNNGLKNLRGAVGMYHGALPNSATFRWYVNTADNAQFDFVDEANPGYAVFGSVVSGIEVVDAISAVETKSDVVTGFNFLPVTNVLITSASQVR